MSVMLLVHHKDGHVIDHQADLQSTSLPWEAGFKRAACHAAGTSYFQLLGVSNCQAVNLAGLALNLPVLNQPAAKVIAAVPQVSFCRLAQSLPRTTN